MKDVIIIGGGLAGLTNALLLNRAGLNVLLIEKKSYPFHRVCGEYVSNEVLPFFRQSGISFSGLPAINTLFFSSPNGKNLSLPLDEGGFGISRYTLDHHLYEMVCAEGVDVLTRTGVTDVRFNGDFFEVDVAGQTLRSFLVIGAYGKRSALDQKMNRPFFSRRSPYIGVKYHISSDAAPDQIALHHFPGGYCGMNKVDNDRYCLCYLAHRDDLRRQGSLGALEEKVLYRNPFLRDIFGSACFLWNRPETINEISFEKKSAVEQHVLMSGDTAGMITPLCGNGMSMAIRSAVMLSALIAQHYSAKDFTPQKRHRLENEYRQSWESTFASRMQAGRILQQLFLNRTMLDAAMLLMGSSKTLGRWLIRQTHGKPLYAHA